MAIISSAGIHRLFRGLKFEPDTEIGRKGVFFKGLGPRAVLMVLLFAFMAGCQSADEAPSGPQVVRREIVLQKKPPAAAQKVQKQKAQEKKASPESQKGPAAVDLAYNPKGKVNPFIPFFEYQQGSQPEKKAKKTRPLTPLERLDLNQLKLVGIIHSATGNQAVVEEASGKGYIITKNTPIGVNSGKVSEILKDRIVIEEQVENLIGVIKTQKRELILQKPPGEL